MSRIALESTLDDSLRYSLPQKDKFHHQCFCCYCHSDIPCTCRQAFKETREKQQADDEQLIISRVIRAGSVRKELAGYVPYDPER